VSRDAKALRRGARSEPIAHILQPSTIGDGRRTRCPSRSTGPRGHDVHTELCLYVIHGVLHLCGYDDRNPKDKAAMRKKEREYLKKLELPDIADEG
jgi:hypothetical protein